jgi:Do/DeqQ family serine protease
MKIKTFLSLIIVAMIGGASVFGLQQIFDTDEQEQLQYELNQVPTKQVNLSETLTGPSSFTEAAERTIDAVVHVKTLTAGSGAPDDLYEFFFGDPYHRNQPKQTAGSGVIISADGYIVTNNHVIKGTDKIEVTLNDNRNYPAELIGSDPATDIALIKIEAENLPVVSYGDSDKLQIGEWVLAVGNPFNLTSTVTAGIVSAKARNINILQDRYAVESFIQTDAAVNPGNSGGALVNTTGELVGINTAIASQTGSFSGYSFAVPVNIVKKIVSDLMEYGTVQRAMLGISIRNIDSELAKKMELEKTQGVFVMAVGENSAAAEAGIQEKDIILKINDRKVTNVPELQEQISKYRPGDEIEVILSRDGKLKKMKATLKNVAGTTDIVQKNDIAILGASFEPASDDLKSKLGISFGVEVSGLKSGKLLKAGVREGFIITLMNRQPVKKIEDIKTVLNHAQGGIYIEGIYPDGNTAYYAFGLN